MAASKRLQKVSTVDYNRENYRNGINVQQFVSLIANVCTCTKVLLC